jgi:RNA polymerase sigma factor (sigma-70 family)
VEIAQVSAVTAPSGEHLLTLHRRLLDGDPTASRDLFQALNGPLFSLLRQHGVALPREDVEEAASDALLELFAHPERYDLDQGTLLNFLVTIGKRRLIDRLRARKRRPQEISLSLVGEDVAQPAGETNQWAEAWSETDELDPDLRELLQEVLPDERDRRMWELVCQGRTAVVEFAGLLGIADRPPDEQKAVVKRERERVVKRVRRRRQEFARRLWGVD